MDAIIDSNAKTPEDPELFQKILEKGIRMYETRRSQIALAPSPGFQKSRNILTLAETFNYVLNDFGITEKDDRRKGLLIHLKREAEFDQRTKAAAAMIQQGPAQGVLGFFTTDEAWRLTLSNRNNRRRYVPGTKRVSTWPPRSRH